MYFLHFQHWDHLKPRLQMKFCLQCELNSSIILDIGDMLANTDLQWFLLSLLQLLTRDLVTAWNTLFIHQWWYDNLMEDRVFFWVPFGICHLQWLVYSIVKHFSISNGSQAERPCLVGQNLKHNIIFTSKTKCNSSHFI